MKIIADSCCDVTAAMNAQLCIEKVSFKINIGERVFVDDGAIDLPELMREMKAFSGPATTACPSPEEFAQCMRSTQDECFVVTISSALSGCYNAAVVARDMVLEESPGRKIHVFDSKSAAAGETRIALLLHELMQKGLTYEEIIAQTEAFIKTMATRFVLEDLSNLIKNGRISKAAGIVGSMLNLRPVLADNGNGEIVSKEKVRGTQNALRRLVAIVAQETSGQQPKSMTLVLDACNCAQRAEQLKKDLLEQCPALCEVVIVPAGGLTTVYANDGGVVLGY